MTEFVDEYREARNRGIERTVLVVDDEPVNREMLGLIVGKEYRVLYAENGKEALEIIEENRNTLSLVLLDLLMPVMNGFELLEAMKKNSMLSHIPVIVLTSDKGSEIRSFRLGAVDFLTKPYDMPEVILARVRRTIELFEDSIVIKATEKDTLTGLYTREYFFIYGKRYDLYHPDREMDAVVVDISHFHLINELYGVEEGNRILRNMADRIRRILDEQGGYACRKEADTFYLYLGHREDYETVRKKIAEDLSEKCGDLELRIRMGINSYADHSIPLERRFDQAEQAGNLLRGQYLESVSYFNREMHERELYQQRLVSDIVPAISERQFKVLFQPKFDIRPEKPVLAGAEALVRWEHPEFGAVSPGEFIPLLEQNGLVQMLDHFVWKEAAAQLRRWKERFHLQIPISVNISRIDIHDPNLEKRLLDLVHENGLSPCDLNLEITESAYTEDSEQMIRIVEKLQSDGFRIEMDDFGTGYSSLNVLASMPIDALKLDMKFIRNIEERGKDYHIVRLVIEMAGYLSVPVIAEGVENEEQCRILKEAGCAVVQGYCFSRPVPPKEFEKYLGTAV